MKKAIFIDKDGTLIQDLPYNTDISRVVLAAGAAEALRQFRHAGYALVVVTNQSGIARGYFDEAAFRSLMQQLTAMLPVPLDGWYFCPHHPEGTIPSYAIHCNCRKPQPGLILEAAEKLDIDLSASWMIGDILHDVEAGNRAGCRSVLVVNGGETEWELSPIRQPAFCVSSLGEAAQRILQYSFTET